MALIDTLAMAKELQTGGFDSRQAEALAQALGRLESGQFDIKAELAELRAELRAETGALRAELRSEFRADMYRFAMGIIGANAAITLGIVRFLS